jgi:hypothetical protein
MTHGIEEEQSWNSAPHGDPYKTLVRLVVGGIGESIDRLMQVSAALDEAEIETVPDVVGPYMTSPIAMAIVGFAYELPEQITVASASASRTLQPFRKIGRVAVETGSVLAEATGLGPFLADVTLPTRQAFAEEFERLVAVGSAEYSRGRVLAVGTFTESVDGIIGYLGDSDEVGELVREQTLGITGAAVQEIRETGAAADGLAEGIFRKIFRKDPKTLPPRPEFEPR